MTHYTNEQLKDMIVHLTIANRKLEESAEMYANMLTDKNKELKELQKQLDAEISKLYSYLDEANEKIFDLISDLSQQQKISNATADCLRDKIKEKSEHYIKIGEE